jgi:hypothetical protein
MIMMLGDVETVGVVTRWAVLLGAGCESPLVGMRREALHTTGHAGVEGRETCQGGEGALEPLRPRGECAAHTYS